MSSFVNMVSSVWPRSNRSTSRTAVCGPACTVVWEGWGRKAPPYPDGVPGMHDGLEVKVLYPSRWS